MKDRISKAAIASAFSASLLGLVALAPSFVSAQEVKPGSLGLPAITFPPQPKVPEIVPGPGLSKQFDYGGYKSPQPEIKLPDGFKPIFNGRDLSGWHVSKTSRHGHSPDYRVVGGMIVGTQQPLGSGGILITDKKYKNYELYFEAKADWGSDSGVFIRTTEFGSAYQLTLDYMPGGSMGRIIGEGGLIDVGRAPGQAPPARPAAGGPPAGPRAPDLGMSLWKPNEWNSLRVRVEGDNPHITVWINDQQVTDFTDPVNHAAGGMVAAPFALQVHGGDHRWLPGNFWRWKNIGIRELP